jgi:hypothetical protein
VDDGGAPAARLFTPARHGGLPGMPFPVPAWSHPTKDEVADYLFVVGADGVHSSMRPAVTPDDNPSLSPMTEASWPTDRCAPRSRERRGG